METLGFVLYFLFNFFIYGFIGWIIENLYCYFKRGHFQKQGFLNSPFKPMYAFAMSSIIALYNMNTNTYFLLLISILVPTIIEYITGIIMRNYFKKDYWDYSKVRYNFQGIICMRFSIYWSVLTFIGVKYFQVYLINILYSLIGPYWIILAPMLIIILMVDNVVTINDFKKNNNIA
ncbi:MAG: putative ABC transporter permease [Clostridium sp.]